MQTKTYDTYGIKDMGLEDAAKKLSDALDIEMKERDSSFKGLYYCFSNFDTHETFELLENFNEFEEDFLWEEYEEFALIFEYGTFKDPDIYKEKILLKLPNATFLDRNTYEKE